MAQLPEFEEHKDSFQNLETNFQSIHEQADPNSDGHLSIYEFEQVDWREYFHDVVKFWRYKGKGTYEFHKYDLPFQALEVHQDPKSTKKHMDILKNLDQQLENAYENRNEL